MNQIIIIPNKNNKKIYFFKIELWLSVFVTLICIICIFYFNINNDNYANGLLSSYSISRLYSNNNQVVTIALDDSPYVFGTIEIPKLKINYPILSTFNDELLNKSICRFYGTNPNEVGNLCLAGHNYNNNKFFSNLDELQIRR